MADFISLGWSSKTSPRRNWWEHFGSLNSPWRHTSSSISVVSALILPRTDPVALPAALALPAVFIFPLR